MNDDVTPGFPSLAGAECPWPAMAEMRGTAAAYQLPDQPDMFVVSRYEDIRYASTHPEVFTSHMSRSAINGSDVMIGPGSPKLVVTESEGEAHKRKRSMAFQAVKPGRLRAYEGMIRELADRLIDGFGHSGRLDFVEAFAGPLPAYVTCRMLGLPEADVEWVREWGRFEVPGLRWFPEERKRHQLEQAGRMFAYLTEKILEHREHPRDDAISHVIEQQLALDGTFDLDEVRAQVTVLLGGGVITTAHFLSTAMYHLLSAPDQLAAVRADPSLIPVMLEEALRIEPPSLWHPRRVVEDTELGGVRIPAGSFVLLMVASGNRDEAQFDHAERFDFSRPNVNEHISFGYGRHFCLGAPLARLESRVAFERLLARLPQLSLAPGNDLRHVPSPQFRGLQRLEIEFSAT